MQTQYIDPEEQLVLKHVTSQLKRGKVVLFTDDGTPKQMQETEKIKQMLIEKNIEFEEISKIDLMTKISLELHTGYVNLPNIYFGQDHIGGIDDLTGHLEHYEQAQHICEINGIYDSFTEDEFSKPRVADRAVTRIWKNTSRWNILKYWEVQKRLNLL